MTRKRAEAASEFMKRLAHPNRLMIVCALVDGERSVGELETRLSIRQPSLSQQLAELREAGIVEGRREVKQVFYRLADPRTAALIATLHRLFCGHVNQHAVLELSSSPRPERSRAIRAPSPSAATAHQRSPEAARFARVTGAN